MNDKLCSFAPLCWPSRLRYLFVLCLFLLSISVADAQVPSRRGAFVYTGNTPYGAPSNALINGYVIDATAGTLMKASGSPFTTDGQVVSILAHPSGRFVYAAVGNGTLKVAGFTVDSLAGTLTPVPGGSYAAGTWTGWDSGMVLAVDPAGKFLYVAGGTSLYAFAIDANTGMLSSVPGSPFSANGVSAVVVDPSGKYLVVRSGSGALAYSINASTGALTAAGAVVSGCGGSFMAFEPAGHFFYGAGSQGISSCSFDSSSGAMVPVAGSPWTSANGFRALAVHPSGAFLYASGSSDGASPTLYGYMIDPASGALTEIGGSPFPFPSLGVGYYYNYGVAAEASGRFVYAVEANSGTVAYQVNPVTGALTLAANSFSGPAAKTLGTAPNAVSASATLTGLEIVPGSAQIRTSTLGKQYQFTLRGTFSDGSTGFLTGSATWSSSDTGVATVAAGLATSTGYGTTTITASVGGVSTTATLTVGMPDLASISVTPQTVTIYQGTAIQLKATGTYADGSSVDVTNTVAWSSSDAALATVSAQALAQSTGLGTATITATAHGVTGTASLTVVRPFVWGAAGSNGTAATVSSGGDANFNLALAPDQNFTGLVTFSCANLPSNWACNVDPPSATVANGNPVSVTVNIKTGQNLSAQTRRLLPELSGTVPMSTTPPGAYTVVVAAASSGNATQTIGLAVTVQTPSPTTPTITWADPAAITYGTALSATQLNATASVPGTFVYSPAAGTLPRAGTQTLSVTFTPTDATNYASVTKAVSLVVAKATPAIAWAAPAAIRSGTALNATQLNATASVPGTFVYSPAAGAVPLVGTQVLSVTFTPRDAVNYTSTTASVSLTVYSAGSLVPMITGLSPALIKAGASGFNLLVSGSNFESGASVYWNGSRRNTTAVEGGLQAEIAGSDIAVPGRVDITVANPASVGGSVSGKYEFVIDSPSTAIGSFAVNSTSSTLLVQHGQSTVLPVTFAGLGSGTSISATCVNLPAGSSCSYNNGIVTIGTSANTPAGTYQVTVIFTAAQQAIALDRHSPAFLASFGLSGLPLGLLWIGTHRRKNLRRHGIFPLCLLLMILLAACGGGGGSSQTTTTTTTTTSAQSSIAVSLTVN